MKCTKRVRAVKSRVRVTVERGGETRTVETVRVRQEKTVTLQGKSNKKPQGVILYRGPSQLDGTAIVAVATCLRDRTKNPKTGNMIQTFILADNGEDPFEAVQSGGDKAVCGDCPHRGGPCYVNVVFAPTGLYKAVQKKVYPDFDPVLHLDYFRGRFVRLGAYGDPAAVPLQVWATICKESKGWTGYTHQWQTCDHRFAQFCMASVDTPIQRLEAIAKGYRTFRVKLAGEPLQEGEFTCPASAEAGHRLSCEECMACSGARGSARNATPAINFHGSTIANGWAQRVFERAVAEIRAEEARRYALPVVAASKR